MGSLPLPILIFALLLKRIGPSRELGRNRDPRRDPSLRLTLMHPALVVGIKGPVMWTKSLASSHTGKTADEPPSRYQKSRGGPCYPV